MRLTFARAAAVVRGRVWMAAVAGGLLWLMWGVGLLLGGSRPLEGHFALGDGETDMAGTIVGVDHLAFYAPARLIREGRAGVIYDYEVVAQYQQGLFPSGAFDGKLEALRNPPFFPLLFTPTATLSYAASVWVWTGVSFAALAAGVWLLAPARPGRTTLWALTFLPTFTAVGYGQTSLLSFAVFCACYRLLAAGYLTAAGVVAAALWFKPPLLLGLLAWWALDWRRYWPAVVGLTAGGALLFALTLPVVPDAWEQFFVRFGPNLKFDSFEWWKSHNARAFWRLLLTPRAAPLPGLLWLASAAAGMWLFRRVWQAQRDNVPILFGASVLLMLWASPHAMVYEWAAATLPAVLFWKYAPAHRDRWLVLYAAVWLVMFVSTDAGRLQEMALRRLSMWEQVPVLQLSLPVVAWAAVMAGRGLTGVAVPSEPRPSGSGGSPSEATTSFPSDGPGHDDRG